MLNAQHRTHKHVQPLPLLPSAELDLSALFGNPVAAAISEPSADPGDLGALTLSDFAARYVDARDGLAYRRLRGDVLTAREESSIAAMNQWLDDHMPKPEGLPGPIRDLIDDILRLHEP